MTELCHFTVFATELDWMALAWTPGGDIRGLAFARRSAQQAVRDAVRDAAQPEACDADDTPEFVRRLIEQLTDYAAGDDPGDFADVPLCAAGQTPFQRRVIAQCRRIPRGRTLSYGHLAARAGSPRAARAVGNVMRGNRVPLIVPCHRVVASAGRLGGFSAPQGVSMKQRLLDLESDCVPG